MNMTPGQESLKVYAQPFCAHSNRFEHWTILYNKTDYKIKIEISDNEAISTKEESVGQNQSSERGFYGIKNVQVTASINNVQVRI